MTREEAIKILKIKQECSDYEGFSCGINMNEYKDGCSTCIEAIDMAIKALQEPERKWIPVSERLPETEDKVMCCTETKKGDKNIIIGYYMEGSWRCGMNSNVVAWQPLPEPYKAGDEK